MAGKSKTYLVERSNEVFKISVPEDWKVTFGAPKGNNGFGGGGNELRFYETKEKQRAVFTNVRSFRDLDLPIQKRVVATKAKSAVQKDAKTRVSQEQMEISEQWIDAQEAVL